MRNFGDVGNTYISLFISVPCLISKNLKDSNYKNVLESISNTLFFMWILFHK